MNIIEGHTSMDNASFGMEEVEGVEDVYQCELQQFFRQSLPWCFCPERCQTHTKWSINNA